MIDIERRAGDEEARPERRATEIHEAAKAIECVLFVSGGPVRMEQLVEAVQVDPEVVAAAVEVLAQDYAGRGLQLQAVAGGYQLGTRPDYADAVRRALGAAGREPLSQAALETLAIVGYRQPITRPELDALRGVHSEHVLERLEERRLIRAIGRKATVGRPILYGTTEAFLRYFGLRDLTDLPPMEAFGTSIGSLRDDSMESFGMILRKPSG